MTDKVYIDASFFIALHIREHIFYLQARKKAEEVRNLTAVFSLFSIDEIMYNLRKYGLDYKAAKEFIEEHILSITNTSVISYPGDLNSISEYLETFLKSELHPRDAVHYYLMSLDGISTIATFDQDFIKRAKELKIKIL